MRRACLALIGLAAILCALIGGAWLLIIGIRREPALVGAALTASGAVIAVMVGRWLDRRAESSQMHREQMAPMYSELIKRFQLSEPDAEPDPSFWTDLSRNMILYGPTTVIRANIRLRRHLASLGEPAELDRKTMVLLDDLYRAIRADLGHDDSKLNEGDLLRLYITDIDELIGPFEATDS